MPEIDSRYPLWDQPNLMRDVDEGRFYLPDAQEGLRETLVCTVIDARPIQCLRVAGPTFVTLWAALFTGGFFILATYHWWISALVSATLAVGAMLYWTWTGTAQIPEKDSKEVGLGLTLPIYVSGPDAVGWWAMFITMTADMTAFISLIFGYFFYWTIHEDFPPAQMADPDPMWLIGGLLALSAAYGLMLLARLWNRKDWKKLWYLGMTCSSGLAVAGSALLIAGPWKSGLEPTLHVYPAMVWVIVGWMVLHIGLGLLMQLYCIARRGAGLMTARYDADMVNVTLYWHFLMLTVAITVAVLAGFPLVA